MKFGQGRDAQIQSCIGVSLGTLQRATLHGEPEGTRSSNYAVPAQNPTDQNETNIGIWVSLHREFEMWPGIVAWN
jgi:hypothetical protein